MDQPLVWIDLEMTGLDPDVDAILEIAVIVTDGKLDQIVEGPDLVLHADEETLARMVDVVREMHHASGLTAATRRSSTTVPEAERRILKFLRRQVAKPGIAPLAGNSVHADRAFLRKHMPELAAWLHYRNVDVSTIKELALRWFPDVDLPDKRGAHRALADIRESIEELKFYRSVVFRESSEISDR